jgi:hypothetical protein
MSGPLIAECIRISAATDAWRSVTIFESYEIKAALNLINTYVKDNIPFTVEYK